LVPEEKSRLLTHTGRGTPGGSLLRRYWQPVALVDDLPSDGAPYALTILGEELVLFRDDAGRLGLLALHCSHRGCELSFGRVENGGLRCVFHGWLFDVAGNCLEQPGEPEGSRLYRDVRHPAYPVVERAGIVFAYLGPGAPPVLPAFESFGVPPEHRVAVKFVQECNYLQAVEGNLDPVHQSFLHRFLGGADESKSFSPASPVGGTTQTNLALYRASARPKIETDETGFGARFYILRDVEPEGTFLRIYNFVLPNCCVIPGIAGADGYTVHWHVPIDDENHWKFVLVFTRSAPVDLARFDQALFPETDAQGRPARTRANRYRQDRAEMKNRWFAGVGSRFSDHDTFANEAQGPIQDRTREFLGYGDLAIVRARRQLFEALEALEADRDPRGVIRGTADDWSGDLLVVTETFAGGEDWRGGWRTRADQRLHLLR
jgi:phthalate 4,5-dioxygenase